MCQNTWGRQGRRVRVSAPPQATTVGMVNGKLSPLLHLSSCWFGEPRRRALCGFVVEAAAAEGDADERVVAAVAVVVVEVAAERLAREDPEVVVREVEVNERLIGERSGAGV